jgi:hypothetical protein
MHIGRSQIRLRVVVLGCSLVMCLGIGMFALNFLWIAPRRNTTYAPGFSEKAFRTIVVGDSEERVIDLLGEPLEQTIDYNTDPPGTYLWYAKPIGPSENHVLRNIVIRDGRVARIYGQIWRD